MTFAEKVTTLMAAHGHSQAELARRLSTQDSAVSNVLAGKRGFNPDQLLALARLYEVSIESLIDPTRDIEAMDRDQTIVLEMAKTIGWQEAKDRLMLAKLGARTIFTDTSERIVRTRHDWGETDREEPKPKPKRANDRRENRNQSS